jgi:pimeloyl-ACP methyl ester carboxylesterase
MTEFLDVPGGRIACDVDGSGPLVVLSHGIGDRRQAYRFLAPMLAQAGYREANADLRGHGESSLGWASITRTDVAGDPLALIGHLGGPAVIVEHSLSGGAATIAAATRPDLVAGVVEINPFTRKPKPDLGGLLRVRRYRRCVFLLTGTQVFRSLGRWLRYLNLAYPAKPADYAGYMAALGQQPANRPLFPRRPAPAEHHPRCLGRQGSGHRGSHGRIFPASCPADLAPAWQRGTAPAPSRRRASAKSPAGWQCPAHIPKSGLRRKERRKQ